MGAHRSRRNSFARLLPAAGGILVLALTAGCGGGGASPTPTTVPLASQVPASPQRPALLSPVASPSAVATSAAPRSSPAAGSQTYTVQAGDTLAKIAQQFYGDSTQWRPIYDANKDAIGDNPDALKLGMQLTIPPAPATTPTPGG